MLGACIAVPKDVKKLMLEVDFLLQQNLTRKSEFKESI